MSTYTVTLTAAQGGRHPHAFRGIEADTPQAAIVAAYRERHGDHVTVTTRDVHARGNDISDTKFSVFGTAGAVTFADVERTDDTASTYTDYTAPGFYDCCGLPKNQGAHSNYCPTVPHRKELPAVEETATETLDRCAAITRKGTQCSREARHGEHCTQHAAMVEVSAQDSETITLEDLADEYDITIQDVTRALGDDSLTEHDGVDAGMARDILNQQTILNISDRVQWNDGDHPVNFVREGEIFEFIPGGFVQVNYRDGTAHRSCTIRRDRLTKV